MKLANIVLLLTASFSSSNAEKSFLRASPTKSGVDGVEAAQQCLYNCADDAISDGQRGRPNRNRIFTRATECASDCLPPALRDATTVACTDDCFREEARDIEREVERAIRREIRECERDCNSEDEDERECERRCERKYRNGISTRSIRSSRVASPEELHRDRSRREFERIEDTARSCLFVCSIPIDNSFAKAKDVEDSGPNSNSNSNSNSNDSSSSSSTSSSSSSADTRRARSVCLREPLLNNQELCEDNRRCEWNNREKECRVWFETLNFIERSNSNSNSNDSSSSSSSSSSSNDTRRARRTCRDESVINNQFACEASSRCEWDGSKGECEVRRNGNEFKTVTSFA